MEGKIKQAYEAQAAFMPSLKWDNRPLPSKKAGAVVLARDSGKKVVTHGVVHLKKKDETLCGQSTVEASVMAIHYKLNWKFVDTDVNCKLCQRAEASPKKAKKGKSLDEAQKQELEAQGINDFADEEDEPEYDAAGLVTDDGELAEAI